MENIHTWSNTLIYTGTHIYEPTHTHLQHTSTHAHTHTQTHTHTGKPTDTNTHTLTADTLRQNSVRVLVDRHLSLHDTSVSEEEQRDSEAEPKGGRERENGS